jgi:hypothetical protein
MYDLFDNSYLGQIAEWNGTTVSLGSTYTKGTYGDAIGGKNTTSEYFYICKN